ncbi:MAG: DMT family transporter [Betaproteobacteria bacterium]|nr:MAG: DMT family transporter [Betaproteobacteria bacterium]
MVAAVGMFTLMDAIAKYLAHWYPVPGIVWARYVSNVALLLAWFAARGELRRLRTVRPGIQFARGLLLAGATLFYFTSLSVLPLADAAAIAFVLPLFIAALAAPMLKERLDAPRLLAIMAGFAGALIIVRPGSATFTLYALLPMAMALCNALYQILTRKVAGVEHPLTSLIWGAIVGAVLMSAVVPFDWKTPDEALHWALLGVLGVLASIGHYLLIRAYDYAPATLLAPYTYSGLVWAMLLGLAVFGNFPDGWSLMGMAVIVASGLFLANRQRLTVRRG